ncbi:Uma2 family endonuclease [Streptomyces sp. NPDC046727]|uniref:Uma2 family endonuclease n=1 Tax=Streptomyces sp. NPDC046727 TaxID=3155373 RepID=UPI0033C2E3D5
MTVLEDRIAMAEYDNESMLDEMFDRLEPDPEGYKVEIVEGTVYMSPQRDTHWEITLDIILQLGSKYRRQQLKSDVRIDYPGRLNGFATDVTLIREGAVKTEKGRWRHEDVEFVAEVISKGTAANDYGPKKAAYATAEVPVYVIADPYKGMCYVYTQPKEGDYITRTKVEFGTDIDLTGTVVDLVLKTDGFPRD